jgi:hypothetical protein
MIRNPFEAPAAATGSRRPSAPVIGSPRRAPAHVVLEEFLVLEELAGLMRFTLAHEAGFVPTTVRHAGGTSVVDAGYRRSRTIFDLGAHHEVFETRILTFLPFIFGRLDQAPFEPTRVEMQITASNEGDFYRPHRDNAHGPLRSRAITFVYYFYRPPKGFTGGGLMIQDESGSAMTMLPAQNCMILFPSGLLHEILPVSCPSRRFADSRFALNGWVHR